LGTPCGRTARTGPRTPLGALTPTSRRPLPLMRHKATGINFYIILRLPHVHTRPIILSPIWKDHSLSVFFLSFISKNWENVQAVIEKPRNRGEPRRRRQSKLASPSGATAGASARRQGSARSASTAPPCRRPRTHSAPPPAPRGPRHRCRCRCSVTVAF